MEDRLMRRLYKISGELDTLKENVDGLIHKSDDLENKVDVSSN